MSRVLVVDDEPADLRLVSHALEKLGHEVYTATTAREGVKLMRTVRPQAAVLDLLLPDADGLDLLTKLHEIDDRLPIILITSSGDSGAAIQAMKLGALDYLIKPIEVAELRKIVERALEIHRLTAQRVEMNVEVSSPDTHAIIGRSPAMQEVYKAIGIVAAHDVPVLIRGESGTGKELVARALYQYSDRVNGPFLAVNCAAIPETLLESELFGHERGSFTGAERKRIGKFEQCRGGTLFLDEIGDMSPLLQSKLLRVLQEKQFERVGGNEIISADVRVIAATNRNLEKMVADGEFRPDLYYRLNGFSIHLPPLRERGDDLELLVEHFRRLANHDLRKDIRQVAPEAMELLRRYSWPGNVRELQNVIRQAALKTTGSVLLADFLPENIRQAVAAPKEPVPAPLEDALKKMIEERLEADSTQIYDEVIDYVENQLVRYVLERIGGDQEEAARRLGANAHAPRSPAARALLGLGPREKESPTPQPLVRPGMTLREIEAEAIRQALEQTHGSRKAAAKLLGISTRTMQRRVKELALDEDRVRHPLPR